jgi:uncharacterized protein DUF6916
LLAPSLDAWPLLAATVDAPAAAANAGTPRGPFRLRDASAAHFRPLLKTSFAVRSTDGAPVALALARVIEGPPGKRFEQFSLMFHAPAGSPPLHGTYVFRHAALGAFDLFIAPVGDARATYEACFSRLMENAACQITS